MEQNTVVLSDAEIKESLGQLRTEQTKRETTNEARMESNKQAIYGIINMVKSGVIDELIGTKSIGVDFSYLKETDLEALLDDSKGLIELRDRVSRDISTIIVNARRVK